MPATPQQVEKPGETNEAGEQLLAGGVSGRRLPGLLGEAVGAWRVSAEDRVEEAAPLGVPTRALMWERVRGGEGELAPRIGLAQRFPAPASAGYTAASVEVRPILTLGELRAEGVAMRHCVVHRARSILQDRVQIYHATVAERALTIELVRFTQKLWCPGQIAGVANREPSRAELEALRPWLLEVSGGHHDPLLQPDLGDICF